MCTLVYIAVFLYLLVLCDTRDISILIVDTYVTIPVSPKSRYTAVYRSNKKYRETAQVSRVSRYHASRTTGQRAECQNERNKHSTLSRKDMETWLLQRTTNR